MDNPGFYAMQPQSQQRDTTTNGNRVSEVQIQLDSSRAFSTNHGYSQPDGSFAKQANGDRTQFENQQLQMQQPRRLAPANHQLEVPRTAGSIAGGSVVATSDIGVPDYILSEDQYRAWLTSNFKFRFDQYESEGGMPLKEFMEMAQAVNFNRTRNLQGLFKRLDKDGNQRVSWSEFFNGMKYTKKSEVPRSKRAINNFVTTLTPAAKKKIKKDKTDAANAGEPIPEESYLEAYTCRPPPLFIPLFYVAVWIFFIVYAVELQRGPVWNRVGWDVGFPYYSPLVFCPSVRQQAWRFLSYMFLHNGYHHIVFNTILSLLLGIPLELVHKFWRVGPVFLIGVVIGSMASSIADPSTMLIGASGGVYALIGAHYALVLMNWEELQDDWLNMRSNPLKFLLSGVMCLIYLTLLIILDFGITFYGRYSGTQTLPVSVAAHIGGLLAGFFSGVPILRNIDKKPWEGKLAIVCLVITCLMFLFGILWNIFYKNFPAAEILICSNTDLATSYG